jgi:uncharacterized protein
MSTESRENRIDYVEFPAPSPESFAAAKRFYQQAFGWSFQDWGDQYSDTKSSGVTSGFSCSSEHRPAGTIAVLYTANLEDARDRTIASGGKIVREIFSFPGGCRFEFTDPAGNRLGVWSYK